MKNLVNLVGSEFDTDDIICAVEDFEEDGVNESRNVGYDYIAYINTADSKQFLLSVEDGVIIGVEME